MKIKFVNRMGLRHIEATILKSGLRLALGLLVLLACGGCEEEVIVVGDTGVIIDEVEISDRFPPDCEEGSVTCYAYEEYNYLILWLQGGDPPSVVYVTDSAGERYDLGSGRWIGRTYLAQRVPASASGFTLHVPGVEPIDLGK